jgi:hypothetical protein
MSIYTIYYIYVGSMADLASRSAAEASLSLMASSSMGLWKPEDRIDMPFTHHLGHTHIEGAW